MPVTPLISHGILTAGIKGVLICDYTLNAAIDNNIPLTVSLSWKVNGTLLESNGRIKMDGVTLTISPLTTSDIGRYECSLVLSSLAPHIVLEQPQPSSEIFITIHGALPVENFEVEDVSSNSISFSCRLEFLSLLPTLFLHLIPQPI